MPKQVLQTQEIKIEPDDRTEIIISWLKRIEKSELTLSTFFKTYEVPFSRSQYYVYLKRYKQSGESGIRDKRADGGNRKVNKEIEAFIAGCVASNPHLDRQWLQKEIDKRYECNLTLSGLSKLLQRLQPEEERLPRGRRRKSERKGDVNSCGGFELIIALAYHLGWPQMTSLVIKNTAEKIEMAEGFHSNESYYDKEGRDAQGRFTCQYNQREEIRGSRFESIAVKRQKKNWKSMNIIRDEMKSIERKSLAVLSLPVITMNGGIRTVNTAIGQELKHFCGFGYRQSSLTKYLNELKYLGVSTQLIESLVGFWSKCWRSEFEDLSNQVMMCYYIDGNTKAVWSSKRVKQNKVTMLGRVMGCLEHVFIHDCFGHPIYFETYSGHGPCGEYVLELFEKIEEVIEDVPGSRTRVCRVLVMDGSSNSVKTLRAFASQQKYHYITTLDNNQWNERKLNFIDSPSRYKYGNATLWEVVLELEDSQEKGYLIRTRGIKIDWDNGKETVLLTSIPVELVSSSEVVRSYFSRWPAEELQFKSMKAAVSLNKVSGYGKQKINDEKVLERQGYAAKMIDELKTRLQKPSLEIRSHEEAITKLIPKERDLRNQSKIEEGKRVLPTNLMEEFNSYEKQIRSHERKIKEIEKEYQDDFKRLRKHQQEWLRLQGKETVYKIDVELDQIVTFYRVSMANLYAYFIKYFLDGQPISMTSLLHRIIHLKARIKETKDIRHVMLDYNDRDKLMMEKLAKAIEKINELNVKGPHGKRMEFSLGRFCLN